MFIICCILSYTFYSGMTSKNFTDKRIGVVRSRVIENKITDQELRAALGLL